jgi:hypothetical protein
MKKKINIVLLFIAFISVGFYRDFLFKSINALLKSWDYEMDYEMPAGLRFFEQLDYNVIVRIKWVLTLVFTGIYLLLTLWTLHVLFNEKRYLRLTLMSYMIVVIISALLSFLGYLVPGIEPRTYYFARYLMGFLQSPLIVMILVPSIIFARRHNNNGADATN